MYIYLRLSYFSKIILTVHLPNHENKPKKISAASQIVTIDF